MYFYGQCNNMGLINVEFTYMKYKIEFLKHKQLTHLKWILIFFHPPHIKIREITSHWHGAIIRFRTFRFCIFIFWHIRDTLLWWWSKLAAGEELYTQKSFVFTHSILLPKAIIIENGDYQISVKQIHVMRQNWRPHLST